MIYAARSVAAKQRDRGRKAGNQRFALLVFGGLLVLLFIGFAVAQGFGDPSVPEGDVAVVEEVPEELGTISEKDLERGITQAAASTGQKTVPKPDDPQYEELKEAALGEALDRIWIQGEAEELGIEVSDKEIADELEKLKSQAFKTPAEYKEFLQEARYTQADVNERVKIQVLSERIQEEAIEGAATPSDAEVEEYYEAAKSTQFTQPETRDARMIVTKEKAEADKVKAMLDEDDSSANWKKLAKRFSTDPATKQSGGLSAGLVESETEDPVNEAIFAAPPSQVEGPLKGPNGWVVFEVEKVTAQKVQPLKEVESQIKSQLGEQAQQQATARFIRNYGSTWSSRTFCAPEFLIERCANFTGDGRPAGAPPACYEAEPKDGSPEACPAPVQQVAPALPGTIDVLTPEGQKLAQRPKPAGDKAPEPPPEAGIPGLPPTE